MLFQFEAIVDIGLSRSVQQDNTLTMPQLILNNQCLTDEYFYDDINGALFAVADGMGGGPHGELASRLVVDGLRHFAVCNKHLLESNVITFINNAIYEANQRLLDHLNEHPEDNRMGSTVVLAIVRNGVLYLGWVGDSRCYLINGNSIKVLSHDHSLVQSLIDEGFITEEEAFYHPNRNIINQSMGMSNIIPSFEKYSLEDNQILLLCSDGLNGMLRDFEILEICNRHSDLKVMVQSLVDAANKAGGHDNISCIGIRLKDYPARAKVFIKNEHHAGSKKSENKIPLKLILLSIFLIIAFIWVFLVLKSGNDTSLQENDRIHSMQTMPVSPDTTAEEDIGMPVESQGFYFIRLKGFNDSLKAQEYLEQLSNQYNNYVFMINYSSNALYEVTVNGFKDEDEANKFIASGQFPSAIIKLQKE